MLQRGSAIKNCGGTPHEERCGVCAVHVYSSPCCEAEGSLSALQPRSSAEGSAHLSAAAREFGSAERCSAQPAGLFRCRVTNVKYLHSVGGDLHQE